MSKQTQSATSKLPGELPEHVEADAAYFRGLSLTERARLLEAVCAAAMDILAARQQMGIAPPEPEPWPLSTQEFMRKHAPNGKRTSA